MKKQFLTLTIMLSMLLTLLPLSATAAITINVSTISDFQSAHPYSNYENTTWIYKHPANAESLEITFSSDTETETNYDFIFIFDGNGNQIGKYSGKALANQTITINGNSVQIKLTSDVSIQKNGFKVINIKANEPVPETKFYGTNTCDGELVQYIDYHEKSDNTLYIESARLSYTGIIPDEIDGKIVTEIGTNSISRGGGWYYDVAENAVIIPKSITKIHKNALKNKPDSIVYFGTEEDWNKIIIDPENENLFSTPLIYGKKHDNLYYYVQNNFEIAIINCDKNAFGKVSIPSEMDGFPVTTIASFAFWNCNEISELNIPESVKNLDKFSIYNCKSLEKVSYSKDVKFSDVHGMFSSSKLESIYIPEGIKHLESGCSGFGPLKEIHIPKTVTYIDCWSFPNIEKTYFYGTEEEWKKIEFYALDYIKDHYNKNLFENVIFVPQIKTQVLNGIFLVTPTNVQNGNAIIFACYNDDKMVYVNPYVYQGETTIPFTTTEKYDKIKVMVWENLECCTPLCEAEENLFN